MKVAMKNTRAEKDKPTFVKVVATCEWTIPLHQFDTSVYDQQSLSGVSDVTDVPAPSDTASLVNHISKYFVNGPGGNYLPEWMSDNGMFIDETSLTSFDVEVL